VVPDDEPLDDEVDEVLPDEEELLEDEVLPDDDEAPEEDDTPEDDELPELEVELLVELGIVEAVDPDPPPQPDRSIESDIIPVPHRSMCFGRLVLANIFILYIPVLISGPGYDPNEGATHQQPLGLGVVPKGDS
jgi:hypothetical protein